MIETPGNIGKQNAIAFSLNDKINKDTMVSLMKDNEAIISYSCLFSLALLTVKAIPAREISIKTINKTDFTFDFISVFLSFPNLIS